MADQTPNYDDAVSTLYGGDKAAQPAANPAPLAEQAPSPPPPPPLAPATAPEPVNPYDDTVKKLYGQDQPDPAVTQLRQSMMMGSQLKPDEAAKALPLAQDNGIPLDTATRNLPELQKYAGYDKVDYNDLYKNYPQLAQFLSHPDNAAVAHDDVNGLRAVSDYIDNGFAGNVRALAHGVSSTVGSTFSQLGTSSQNVSDILQQGLIKDMERHDGDSIGYDMNAGLSGAFSTLGDVLHWASTGYEPITNALAIQNPTTANKVSDVVGQMGAYGYAATVEGGAKLLAPLFYLSGVGSSLENQKKDVVGPLGPLNNYGSAKGELAAWGVSGPVNALLGSTAFTQFLHTVPPSVLMPVIDGLGKMGLQSGGLTQGFITRALDYTYRSLVSGATMGGLQATNNAADKFLLGHTDRGISPGVGEQAGMMGAATFIMSALTHAPTMFNEATTRASQAYLQNGKDVIQNSKLMQRSPQKMNEFVNNQTGGADVHVNPEGLQTFYQSRTPEQQAQIDKDIPDLAKRINDGLTTNADVPINQADYHTYLQPHDEEGTLDQYTKLLPEHMSAADAEAQNRFMQELVDNVQSDLKNGKSPAYDTEEGLAAHRNAYDQLLRYTGVGRTPSSMVDSAEFISRLHGKMTDNLMKVGGGRGDVADIVNRLLRDITIQRSLPPRPDNMQKGDMDIALDDLRNLSKKGDESSKRLEKRRAEHDARKKAGEQVGKFKTRSAAGPKAATPLMDYIASLGGVRRGSPDAKELANGGVTPQTHPKLFSKNTPPDARQGNMMGGGIQELDTSKYGLGSLDLLETRAIENETGHSLTPIDDYGRADPQDIRDTLVQEGNAKPELSDKDIDRENLSRMLDYLGMDVNKNSNTEIKRAYNAAYEEQARAADQNSTTFDQSAFHGSPRKFDRFSLSGMGTGEGAQAFGWGLYFADKKDIAEYYREALSAHIHKKEDGTVFDYQRELKNPNVRSMFSKSLDVEKAIEQAKKSMSRLDPETEGYKYAEHDLDVLEKLKKDGGITRQSGQLYQVEIPETETMLDWDKPYEEQPQSVRDALQKAGIKPKDAPAPPKNAVISLVVKKALKLNEGNPKNLGLVVDNDQELYNAIVRQMETKGIDSEKTSPGEYVEDQARDYINGLKDQQEFTGQKIYNLIAKKHAKEVDDTGWSAYHADTEETPWSGHKGASLELNDLGVKGIKYLDGGSRSDGEGSSNYVVFDDKAVKIIKTFYQGGGVDPRGSITFTPDGNAVIKTFAGEDLSTVLHEFGHLYWKAMTDIGNLKDAPPEVIADVNTIREWVGAEPGDALTVEQEEKVADGFLSYLRGGEAPSADLQTAFSRFKGWLTRLYQGARDSLPKISPEVKDVFDRMLATKDEMDAVRATAEFQPDPTIAAMMTKAERERYKRAQEAKIRANDDELFRKAMRQSEAQNTKAYKEERDKVEKIATDQINGERGYRTLDEIIKAGGLNKKATVKAWGEESLAYLTGKGIKIAGKGGGADPEMMAGLMGYDHSHDMRNELMNLKPKREAIRELTDNEMTFRRGDMLKNGTIEGEALKVFHDERKASLLHMEMEAAAKAAKIPAPSKEAIKARAVQMLADMQVKDINAHRFYQAELKASRDAGLAAGKKDYEGAAVAKGRQLLNHNLYRLTLDARAEVDGQIEKWSKQIINKKDKTINVKTNDVNYLNAARYMLSRHGLGSKRFDDKWFQDWQDQMNFENSAEHPNGDKEAYEAIQAAIAVERNLDPTPYKNMPFSDFMGLADAVNGITLIGKDRAKFTANGKAEELKVVKQSVFDQMAKHDASGIATGFGGKKNMTDKVKTYYLSSEANMRRIEHWARMMDLGNAGPIHDYIFQPMKRASLAYRDENNTLQQKIYELLKPHEESLHGEKIVAPELLNEKVDKAGNPQPGNGETYTFNDLGHLIGMMAHLGNPSNKSKLLRGYGWSEDNMNRFMTRMFDEGVVKKEHMDLVQSLWQITKDLKPRLWAAHKELYGFYPDSVTSQPLQTPFGEYEGGYWPARADKILSPDAQKRADEQVLNDSNASSAFPTTGSGALKSRNETYAAPLEMRLNLLANHLDWALRFIHIEPVAKDVAKIVMSRDFRTHMDRIDPTATSEMLVPWLNRTTKQITEIPSHGSEIGKLISGVARTLQTNAGIQALSGNIANVGIHTTALAEFTHALGIEGDAGKAKAAYRIAESTAKFLASPIDMTHAQDAMSAELRTRGQVGEIANTTKVNRLLRDQSTNEVVRAIRNLSAVKGALKVGQASHDHAYILQAMVWHVTDRIGWDSAYNMALDGEARGIPADDHDKAVEYADGVVRRIQGSHNPEDISNVQMRSALAKMFTFLHGWFNNQKNYGDTERYLIKMSGKSLASRSASRFYLTVMTSLLVGAGGGMIANAVRGATPMQNDKDKREGTVAVHLAKDIALDMVRYKAGQYAFAGQIVNGIINTATGQNFADTISPSPVLDQAFAVPRTVKELYHMSQGKGHDETAIGDLLSSIGMATGLPTTALKKPAKYLIKVHEGREHPANAGQYIRGVLGGPAPKQ